MTRVLYGLIFILIALPAAAQQAQEPPPWYEVEIILFEHLDPAALRSEQWPLDVVRPDLSDTIELSHQPPEPAPPLLPTAPQDDTSTPVPYLILPPAQYQLNEAYQRLVNAEQYLPYLHIAWRQIIPPRETPDRIFIHDEIDNAPPEEPVTTTTTDASQFAPDAPSAAEIFAADMLFELPTLFGPPEHTLSGVISIGVGRYLHVNADLLLYKPQQENGGAEAIASDAMTPPAPPPLANELLLPAAVPDAAPIPELFRIQGDLRLRSGEVHYLDHPLVGMLILFTPYTPPEPEETPAADSDTATQPFVDPDQSGSVPTPQ